MNAPNRIFFRGPALWDLRAVCALVTLCILLPTASGVRAEPGSGPKQRARPDTTREREREAEREDEDEEEEEREKAAGKSADEIAEERRRHVIARQGPASPGSPLEQGVQSLVRLRIPGPPERFCAGALVGSTTATVLAVTSARCLAGSGAEPPVGVELTFAGGKPNRAPIVRFDPRWSAAQRAHKPPPPGSDLAVVMAAVAPPTVAAPLFLLDPDRETMGELAERGLALLGYGDQGPLGRPARLESASKDQRATVVTRPRAGVCAQSDAGGALTAFIPPETYLLGVVSPPSKAGTCEAVLLGADPEARAFLLSMQPLLGIDIKRCTRSSRTAHVWCADLGRGVTVPAAVVKPKKA